MRTSKLIVLSLTITTLPAVRLIAGSDLAAPPAAAQAVSAPVDFAGVWRPTDPARSDWLFDVGLVDASGLGMTIVQDDRTLSIDRIGSSATAARASINPSDLRSIYRLDGSASPAGTDPTEVSTARWENSRLVITTRTSRAEVRTTLSLNGSLLTAVTSFRTVTGVANTVSVEYQRVSR
jgi:hypothetical protein